MVLNAAVVLLPQRVSMWEMKPLHLGLNISGNVEHGGEEGAPVRIRRLWREMGEPMPICEVQHQGRDFVERLAFGSDQDRHQAGGIYGKEGGGAVLAIQDINPPVLVFDLAFLEQPLHQRCAGKVTSIKNVHR